MRMRSWKVTVLTAAGLLATAGVSAAPPPAQRSSKPAARRVQPPPPVRVTPVRTATMQAPRHLALVGVTRIGDRARAWLVDRNSQTRATVAPGQSVFGYRVKQITGERVVLSQNGRQFSLGLDDNPEPQSLVAGYQSEVRVNGTEATPSSPPPATTTSTGEGVPANPASSAGNTTIVEVNPVTEVRQVPAAGAAPAGATFDPGLAGTTFYPGLGAGYPNFVPLYPEEAIYPGAVYGNAPYGATPYGVAPYGVAPNGAPIYGPATYPVTPYGPAYPFANSMEPDIYPGEGITRGRYSGNYPGYGPWAPPYPSGQPRGVYSADWPQDLRFIPLQRGNPQTFRRRSGDYGGEGYSNNPQTRRRRDYYSR